MEAFTTLASTLLARQKWLFQLVHPAKSCLNKEMIAIVSCLQYVSPKLVQPQLHPLAPLARALQLFLVSVDVPKKFVRKIRVPLNSLSIAQNVR